MSSVNVKIKENMNDQPMVLKTKLVDDELHGFLFPGQVVSVSKELLKGLGKCRFLEQTDAPPTRPLLYDSLLEVHVEDQRYERSEEEAERQARRLIAAKKNQEIRRAKARALAENEVEAQQSDLAQAVAAATAQVKAEADAKIEALQQQLAANNAQMAEILSEVRSAKATEAPAEPSKGGKGGKSGKR